MPSRAPAAMFENLRAFSANFRLSTPAPAPIPLPPAPAPSAPPPPPPPFPTTTNNILSPLQAPPALPYLAHHAFKPDIPHPGNHPTGASFSAAAIPRRTGRARADAVSEGGAGVATRVRGGDDGGVGITSPADLAGRDGVREPARAIPADGRTLNRERAARLERQRGEERRERVRRVVGGMRIPGHDYGDGGEAAAETARARQEGVWVGPFAGAGDDDDDDGDLGSWLGSGGCAMGGWQGEGGRGGQVAVDESGWRGHGEGGLVREEDGEEESSAEDEPAEEGYDADEEAGEGDEGEVEWSEIAEDDDYLSSSPDTALREESPLRWTLSLSPPPAWGDGFDAASESNWDDEEESSLFTDDMIWDEELGRQIVLVSSSFTTRDEGALVEVTEIHLDGEDEEEGV